MLFVKTENLKIGMRVAKPIYNRLGVLLYDRESTLTEQAIASVKNFSLLGLYILEPAEPAPLITQEEANFERFQSVSIFRLKETWELIQKGEQPKDLKSLADTIIKEFGHLDHKFPFAQNLRSKEDYYYKHCLNSAIVSAMLCNQLKMDHESTYAIVVAALLQDVGIGNLPDEIQAKSDSEYTAEDLQVIERYKQVSYQMLNPSANIYNLPVLSLKTLAQTSQFIDHPLFEVNPKVHWTIHAKIILLANKYDDLTAMGVKREPASDIQAIGYLRKRPDNYDPSVLDSLTDSIQIVPRGCSVELSNGKKGLVIEDNKEDFMAPIVLMYDSNTILDLSNPLIAAKYHIVDIMKTMDNRIEIDEHTLEHFKADTLLQSELNKIKTQKAQKEKSPAIAKPAKPSGKIATPLSPTPTGEIKSTKTTEKLRTKKKRPTLK
ncbi:MAG: hypothetical protein K6A30_08165 [Lachnospiraceae bacterium]|nr:hypothetical protein [Lachnospiraceae bacterium]